MAEGVNRGFVAMFRKMLDKREAWDAISMGVWLYLIMEANWKDVQRKDGVVVPRGSLRLPVAVACRDLGLSRQQLRTVLRSFRDRSMIVTQPTNKFTLVSICNYDTYQTFETPQETTHQPTRNQQETNEQPLYKQGNKGTKEPIEENTSKEIPTGFGPMFVCRDVKPAYLTEFEYKTLTASIGKTVDRHLNYWANRSKRKDKPWRVNRENLVERLIERWEGVSSNGQKSLPLSKQPTTEELFAQSAAAETEAARERRLGKI